MIVEIYTDEDGRYVNERDIRLDIRIVQSVPDHDSYLEVPELPRIQAWSWVARELEGMGITRQPRDITE
jgi:hypothetical protein